MEAELDRGGSGEGSKWSLASLWAELASRGENVERIRERIDDVVLKTLIAAQPSVISRYNSKFRRWCEWAVGMVVGGRGVAPIDHTTLPQRPPALFSTPHHSPLNSSTLASTPHHVAPPAGTALFEGPVRLVAGVVLASRCTASTCSSTTR